MREDLTLAALAASPGLAAPPLGPVEPRRGLLSSLKNQINTKIGTSEFSVRF